MEKRSGGMDEKLNEGSHVPQRRDQMMQIWSHLAIERKDVEGLP